jgi:hypothetical protein
MRHFAYAATTLYTPYLADAVHICVRWKCGRGQVTRVVDLDAAHVHLVKNGPVQPFLLPRHHCRRDNTHHGNSARADTAVLPAAVTSACFVFRRSRIRISVCRLPRRVLCDFPLSAQQIPFLAPNTEHDRF